MSTVFVLNAGSSSLEYALVDPGSGETTASGSIERIGEPDGDVPDHETAVRRALDQVIGRGRSDPFACGHRVVHGGDRFDSATVIDGRVEAAIEELSELAPLHNAANLAGIRAARAALPNIPHVAVFDTAFHRTIPPAAANHAIDTDLAEQFGIRRYGFHGISHQYVSRAAAKFLGRPLAETKLIVLHIGNGASACAIDGGRSIETSMGMSPLEGLVMGTRSGDIDPTVIFHLHRKAGLGFDELESLLNRGSGLRGLSGHSDMRDVQSAALDGDARAGLAIDVYRHRIRRYVGAYTAHLHGLDAVVFTAGVGEHDSLLRRRTMAGLDHLGMTVDPDRNELAARVARRISPEGSPVAVLVVLTNEELEIANQSASVVRQTVG